MTEEHPAAIALRQLVRDELLKTDGVVHITAEGLRLSAKDVLDDPARIDAFAKAVMKSFVLVHVEGVASSQSRDSRSVLIDTISACADCLEDDDQQVAPAEFTPLVNAMVRRDTRVRAKSLRDGSERLRSDGWHFAAAILEEMADELPMRSALQEAREEIKRLRSSVKEVLDEPHAYIGQRERAVLTAALRPDTAVVKKPST